MDDLPTDYDAIVVGTGMTESVIAAALSRVGKRVLHIDPNEFYGENWASFSLEAFENWINKSSSENICNSQTQNENFNDLLEPSESFVPIKYTSNVWNTKLTKRNKKNVEKSKEINEESEEKKYENEEVEVKEEEPDNKLEKLSRRFNLDLCPKLLFSKGLLVQLLISSNIARYAEFKSVTRVLTWRGDQLEFVPCSRADVFATKNVSVVQKRILVKILTLFANYNENLEEFQGFENKTFLDYLKHKKLPDNLIHYILYAIAMGDNTTPCLVGVKACKAFLESLGRYGNTPFIFPMYGCGELPQCFCRLCAVFGGIYCLQRGIEGLIIKDKKCVGVVSDKKRLNAENVILSYSFAPEQFMNNESKECISRGVFITNRSILKSEKESLTLLQFPPVPQVLDKTVTVIELGPGTCTCPDDFYVVHMTAKMSKDAASDIKHVVNSLFEEEEEEKKEKIEDSEILGVKPKILWSSTWNMKKGTSRTLESCPLNVKICCGVDSDLDYDFSISEGKRIFKELYPDEEFLPRAPDPDEIVLDTEEKVEAGGDVNTETPKNDSDDKEKAEPDGDVNTETPKNDSDDKKKIEELNDEKEMEKSMENLNVNDKEGEIENCDIKECEEMNHSSDQR